MHRVPSSVNCPEYTLNRVFLGGGLDAPGPGGCRRPLAFRTYRAYRWFSMGKRDAESGTAQRKRILRWAALAIISALLLAVACFFTAGWLRIAALFAEPHPGAFGTVARDFRYTPEQYAAFEAQALSLRARASALTYLSQGLVAASAIATGWCAWQTRAEVKRWHWLSFLGLACLVLFVILGDLVGIAAPAMLGLLALDAFAFACAAVDLTRRQYGTPGRVVAWATGTLSVGLGALGWTEALGVNGIIGRWLAYR